MKPAQEYSRAGVERKALAEVLQREIDRLGEPGLLAHQIAASGLMHLQTAQRRLYAILTGKAQNRQHERIEQQVVAFDTADKILTALGLAHLWHTELADHLVNMDCSACGGSLDSKTRGCKRCHDRHALRRVRLRKRGPAVGFLLPSGATSSDRRAA